MRKGTGVSGWRRMGGAGAELRKKIGKMRFKKNVSFFTKRNLVLKLQHERRFYPSRKDGLFLNIKFIS